LSDEQHRHEPIDGQIPDAAAALVRMVDFRIPLPWLLAGCICAVGSLVGMYYQLQAVADSMKELSKTVKESTVATTALQLEQSRLQFRLDAVEGRLTRIEGARDATRR
jgi:hypothetical protein